MSNGFVEGFRVLQHSVQKLSVNDSTHLGPPFLQLYALPLLPVSVSELDVFQCRVTLIILVPSNAQFVHHFSVLLSASDLLSE